MARNAVQTSSTPGSCPHNGIQWQYLDNDQFTVEETMKTVCSVSCSSDPPTAPAGATSDWDGTSKEGGTVVTFACPDTINTRKVVCDAATQTWKPDTPPAC